MLFRIGYHTPIIYIYIYVSEFLQHLIEFLQNIHNTFIQLSHDSATACHSSFLTIKLPLSSVISWDLLRTHLGLIACKHPEAIPKASRSREQRLKFTLRLCRGEDGSTKGQGIPKPRAEAKNRKNTATQVLPHNQT